MNKNIERMKMVKAMEFIARQINDEDILMSWFIVGVADEDIPYGELEMLPSDEENYDYYIEDDNFKDLMALFLRLMTRANKSGGLYCGDICSE